MGVALTICLINSCLYFFPGNIAAWVIFGFYGLCSLCVFLKNKFQLHLIFKGALDEGLFLIFTLAFGIWHLWPCYELGYLVPLEGTGNHDEFWYIYVANWLSHHDLSQSFGVDILHPVLASARLNLGPLPRFGAESLIVVMSSLGRVDLVAAFVLIFTFGAVLMVYTVALGISEISNWSKEKKYFAVILSSLSPVFLFIYGNMNFATCFGIALMGGYFFFLRNAYVGAFRAKTCLPVGLFLAAIYCTYPEILAVVVPTTIFYMGFIFVKDKASLRPLLLVPACIIGISVAFAPFGFIKILAVFTTIGGAIQQENLYYLEYLSHLKSLDSLWYSLTLRPYVPMLNVPFENILVEGGLLMVLLAAPLILWRTWGLILLSTLLIVIFFVVTNNSYGAMKAIEFSSLPLTLLFSCGLANLLWPAILRVFKAGLNQKIALYRYQNIKGMTRCLIGVAATFLWVESSLSLWEDFRGMTIKSHLTSQLKMVEEIDGKLKSNEIIYVSDDLLPDSFMASRWAAYFLQNTPLIFAPPVHFGGYLFDLEYAYYLNIQNVSHILRKKVSTQINEGDLIPTNSAYEIVPLPHAHIFYGRGFYANETGVRWMGQEGSLLLRGNCLSSIEITVLRQFEGIQGHSGLKIILPSGKEEFILANDFGRVKRFPLNNIKDGIIKLRSVDGAVSPAIVGLNNDQRPLSFLFGKITLMQSTSCPSP